MERTMKSLILEGDHRPLLPDDIWVNIFQWLPVKSLIRSQSVCKHWRNLIKKPSFIAEHLRHSSHQNSSLLLGWRGSSGFHLVLLDCDMREVVVQSSPLIDSLSYFRTYVSSNGLLCISDGSSKSIILWNPATREIKEVPISINDFKGVYEVGFGFSPVVNDYKIVIFYMQSTESEHWVYRMNRVEVYSLRTKSWKEVEFGILDGLYVSSFETVSTNGYVFWFGYVEDENGDDDYCTIVSFDIANEVFTCIPMPDMDDYDRTALSLTVYEDNIAVLCVRWFGQDNQFCVELWVMKEVPDTSEEPWIWTYECFSFGHCPGVSMLFPITSWSNEIVCKPQFESEGENDETKSSLYLIKHVPNEFSTFHTRKHGDGLRVLNYVESLVPIDNIHVENPYP